MLRLKSSSLVLTIIISVVILTILMSFFYVNNLSYYFNKEYLIKTRLNSNLNSAITILKGNRESFVEEQEIGIDLFGNGADSVKICRKLWGVFELINIRSRKGLIKKEMSLLFGLKHKPNNSAVILNGLRFNELFLVGKAFIEGDVFNGDRGCSQGVMKDINNIKTIHKGKLLTGSELSERMPDIDSVLKIKLLSKYFDYLNKNNQNSDLITKDSISNSFKNASFVIIGDKITTKRWIVGNVIVVAKKEIRIAKNTHLQNVIIIAPKIIVESGFNGNAQLFATDTIIIGENAKFHYPSAILMLNSNESGIVLKNNVHFAGDIFAIGEKINRVSLEDQTRVKGVIYSNGYFQLKGQLWGEIRCNGFYLFTNDAIYQNYILNGIISKPKLNENYVGSMLFINKHQIYEQIENLQ